MVPAVLRFVYLFFPYGSRRWLLLKSSVRILRHPRRYVKYLSGSAIREYFRILSGENRIQYDRKVEDVLDPDKAMMSVPGLVQDNEGWGGDDLLLPDGDQPLILFIYVCRGTPDTLLNSVKSLLRTVSVPCRIVLSGDPMTFASGHPLSRIGYLEELGLPSWILRHPSLKAVCFLDDASIFQQETVGICLNALGTDTQTGMVVPRIISDASTLASAGVILWRDGSFAACGKGRDPGAPEYSYVKDVDSGDHFAMASSEIFLEWIQGEPLSFNAWPYALHDLSMQVRASARKVVYQPLAQVLLAGRLPYNVNMKDRVSFFNRWKTQLEKHHMRESPENVFMARERGQERKYMLMIDYNVPMYDVSAGSRTMQCYIRLFIEKGYLIKFVSDYFYPPARLVSPMEQQGIEVLQGARYEANLRHWLAENGKVFSVIFLSRPVISAKYLEWVKEFTRGKIIYYGHDLHYLRAYRRYQVEHKKGLLKEADRFRALEKKLFESCDVIYYPSQSEIEIIQSEFNMTRPARAIVPYIYDEFPQRQADWGQKKGIMFLGGFHHPPNVDAVSWFLDDIWPVVKAQLTGIEFTVVGSDPPDTIRARHSDQVRIKGLVSDEELEALYEESRIVVAPLRYGAGLKGKIVEAMYHGLPVVTTSIGAEGLEGAGHILQIADDPAAFAQKIIDLYTDESKLKRIAEASLAYVKDNFSKEKAFSIIQNDLP